MYGRSLQRGISAIRCWRGALTSTGRVGTKLRPVRLRHSAQSDCRVRLRIAAESPKPRPWLCAERLANFWDRVLAQRDSILCAEHTVFGRRKWHRAGRRTAVCQRCSRRPALRTQSHSRCYSTRHDSVAQPQCFRLYGGSQHGRMQWWRQRSNLSVWKSWPQLFARTSILVERLLSHKMVSVDRARKVEVRSAILQSVQPSEFRTSEHGACGHPRKALYTDRLRSANLRDLSADRPARRGSRR